MMISMVSHGSAGGRTSRESSIPRIDKVIKWLMGWLWGDEEQLKMTTESEVDTSEPIDYRE